LKTFKFLHRWLGVIAAIFILMFAMSGIVLNHRSFFSGIDVNRKYLPKDYHYNNWNLSAVKSAFSLSPDSLLLYGNAGIILTDSRFENFTHFTEGMKNSADNRRTTTMMRTRSGNILAGTMSGLFLLENNVWKPVHLPGMEKRITGMSENEQEIWVLTRSNLIVLRENNGRYDSELLQLPHPAGYKKETSLFRALWVIHSGKILGTPGKLLVDLLGIIMIILSLTGIVWFIAPDLMKAMKKKVVAKKNFARFNKFSLKWHNHLGIWSLAFLLILALTGMFLRPPLLIPIIRKTFPAVKYTILDHPNPWYDKLRDIQYDRLSGYFIISTSEGFYTADLLLADSLRRIPLQPPVSVMGINVFEQPADGEFIVGSFSGIYRWFPSMFLLTDFISGMPVQPARGMANPFGSVAVAGYLENDDKKYLFDYNAGIVSMTRGNPTFEMPEHIRKTSPMPLWNIALEVHTGRFYSFMLGKYNILFIPIAGLFITIILISGGILWLRNYRRKSRRKNSPACH
jgi:hypothetical protein